MTSTIAITREQWERIDGVLTKSCLSLGEVGGPAACADFAREALYLKSRIGSTWGESQAEHELSFQEAVSLWRCLIGVLECRWDMAFDMGDMRCELANDAGDCRCVLKLLEDLLGLNE